MKKRIITLITSVLLLGILVGFYVILTNVSEKEDEQTTAAPPVSYTVASIDIDSLYAMGFTYNGESFDLTLKDDGTGWLLKGKEQLPISNMVIAEISTYFSLMSSDYKLSAPDEEKKAEYGFDKPTCEVYFYDRSGRHGYTVGMLNSFNSMYYIQTTDDKSSMYLVPGEFMESLKLSELDLLEIKSFPAPSLTKEITLELSLDNDKLTYRYYPSGKSGSLRRDALWYLSVNGKDEFPINEDVAERLTSACKYMGFAECVSYAEEDILKFGLDKPVKLKLDYTNITTETDSETGETLSKESKESHEFLLGGSNEDGYSHAKESDSPLIYVTASDIYEELFGFELSEVSAICTAYITNVNSDDINELTFTLDGVEYTLKIEEDSIGVKYMLNGKETDAGLAKKLVEAVSSLSWDTDRSKEASTLPEKSILTFTLKSENRSLSFGLSAYSDKFCAVTVDYTDTLLMSGTKLEKLTDIIIDIIK